MLDARWCDGTTLCDNGTLPPVKICREIIWEMYELNFRSELVLLDCFVFNWAEDGQKKAADRISPSERRMIVLNLIPHFGSSMVMDYSDFQLRGFASHSAIEQRLAICGLVAVMRDWTGLATLPTGIDETATSLAKTSAVTPDIIEEFGKSVGRHYIRTFYKVFARPPTLPRRMVQQI